jgi:uncharacterized protein DUF4349
MSTPRKRVAIIAVATLALALAGCGDSSKSSSTSSRSDSGGAPAAGPAIPAPADPGGGAGSNGNQAEQDKAAGTPGPVDPAALQRSIIYTGTLSVRVENVDTAAAQAQGVVIGAGGYVGGDNRVIDSKRSSAVLILRVPAQKFDSTVDAVSHLGTEIQRQVSTEDVTSQIIDVASRVKTQQASVDRIRTLLAQANSVSEIVSIESELTRREADLESLQAQQRSLADLSSLSTITVTFLGPEAVTKAVPKKKDKAGFISGLTSGWNTFTASVSVLLNIVGALLPFLVVIGIPLLVWWMARRRRRAATLALATATVAERPAIPEPLATP